MMIPLVFTISSRPNNDNLDVIISSKLILISSKWLVFKSHSLKFVSMKLSKMNLHLLNNLLKIKYQMMIHLFHYF